MLLWSLATGSVSVKNASSAPVNLCVQTKKCQVYFSEWSNCVHVEWKRNWIEGWDQEKADSSVKELMMRQISLV